VGEQRLWYLVSYDVREPDRLRRTYRLLQGYGRSVQYSIFRCRLSRRQLERLRWELSRVLQTDDGLMIASLCASCAARVIVRNPRVQWVPEPPPTFRVI
jgi:CRISPR-associated protein Cas2